MKDKRVALLGFGLSGQAAARFLLKRGAKVTAFDQRKNLLAPPEGVVLKDDRETLGEVELMIVSPGISPSHPLFKEAVQRKIPYMGEAELALQVCKGKVLGVTGTNGKTTVTALTAHVLNQCGIRSRAVGNIGKPLSDEVDEPTDCFVVELSSYQLETLQTKVLDAAVILNITPDHLERYGSMEAYATAKLRIANCLKSTGKCFAHPAIIDTYSHLVEKLPVQNLSFLSLPNTIAPFERENLSAAYALCQMVGITKEEFLATAESFRKPAHRLEPVGIYNGVSVYNDSKGTNVDAVLKAVEGLNGPIILIAGGKDKGVSYDVWNTAFKDKVRLICLYGEAADRMRQEINSEFSVKPFKLFSEAVNFAVKEADSGDTILLSPGCSSFDQFRDFEERGEIFKDLIHQLFSK